jgi:hypothetical protein
MPLGVKPLKSPLLTMIIYLSEDIYEKASSYPIKYSSKTNLAEKGNALIHFVTDE